MVDDLISALQDICVWGAEAGIEASGDLDALANGVDWRARAPEPAANVLPVVERYMEAAGNLAAGAVTERLARQIAANAWSLPWVTAYPEYADDAELADFRRNSAYAAVVGEGGLVPSREFSLYVGMQGPKTFYPPHVHQAREVYLTIAGTAEWKRGREDWKRRPPGDFILHPGGTVHATRSHDEPILAFAAWTSHLASHSVIVKE
jgi:mannose-6-phosphate isomerase-like protein (cupin superfamily)